MAMNTTH